MSEATLNTIGIGRVTLDGHHVAGFRYELDDARLAAALLGCGVGAKLYSGKAEARISDLARQLARMRTDAYLFFVTPDTLGAVAQLASGLQLIRPHVRLLFWGAAAGTSTSLSERISALGEWIASDHPLAVLRHITDANAGGALPSPYLSGLLTATEVTRLGLAANQGAAQLADELRWLNANASAVLSAVPLAAQQLDNAGLRELVLVLAHAVSPLQFTLHVDASACTAEVLAMLPAEKLARLCIRGGVSDLSATTARLSALIVPADQEAQRVARAAVYGRNGGVALHTGFYFDAKQSPGIYHLEVPLALDRAQRASVYAWAGSSMDIRSAAILKGTAAQVDDRLDDFIAPLSRETGGWPKHAYALGADGTHGADLTFDGVTSSRQALRYVALSELDMVVDDSDAVTFVTMHTARDADALEQRLAKFHRQGEITIPIMKNGVHLENSCRWMSYGACRLPLLRRIQVHPSMGLSSCRDAGEVGTMGDNYDDIVTRVRQRQQMDEVRRGCASCRVRDQCSHCSQLPDAWGGAIARYVRPTNPVRCIWNCLPAHRC
jgi:hypothetical protein